MNMIMSLSGTLRRKKLSKLINEIPNNFNYIIILFFFHILLLYQKVSNYTNSHNLYKLKLKAFIFHSGLLILIICL